MLEGSRGLLFTNEAPDVVTDWFESFKRSDFARTGNKATETFELPAGESRSCFDSLSASRSWPEKAARKKSCGWLLGGARTSRLTHAHMLRHTGPIMINDDTAPHSLEPQFRKLGMSTSLLKGIPTLTAPHTVCKEGDTLNPNQVNLLKLFGKTFATVSI